MDVPGPGGKQLQPIINFCACVIAYSGKRSICQESEGKGVGAEFSGKKKPFSLNVRVTGQGN